MDSPLRAIPAPQSTTAVPLSPSRSSHAQPWPPSSAGTAESSDAPPRSVPSSSLRFARVPDDSGHSARLDLGKTSRRGLEYLRRPSRPQDRASTRRRERRNAGGAARSPPARPGPEEEERRGGFPQNPLTFFLFVPLCYVLLTESQFLSLQVPGS